MAAELVALSGRSRELRIEAPDFPSHSLPTCLPTQVAVIIEGASLAGLQLPLNRVDEVLWVIGLRDLLLSGREDLAWKESRVMGRGRSQMI